jgi:adenine-specific DNA-methyltransferase
MMYPRLRLARTLLRDDGVLLVSCNDVEQAHTKVILAELFGEENHAATFIWNNEGNIDNQSKIKANHEFIHVFAKNIDRLDRPAVIDPNIDETSKLYNDEIENSITKNGPANPPSKIRLPTGFPATFAAGVVSKRKDKWPHIFDEIVVKDSRVTQSATVESGWSSRNLLQLFIDNGFQPIRDSEGKETRFAITASGAIYGYKKRSDSQGHVLTVLRNVGTTKQNSAILTKWGISFDWPKPLLLIRYLCQVFTKPGDLIVDFFAGSGTTAHAVMALNARDGGDRSFICIQFPEPVEGSFDDIARLAVHRIRSAGAELASEHPDRAGGQFGVRVLRYAASNFRAWEDYDGEDLEQLEALFEESETPLVKGWTPQALLTEVVLLQGFPLDACVEAQATLEKNDVRLVSSDYVGHRLWVCLDRKIHSATVAALAPATGDVVVCLDAALDDEAKQRIADRCTLETI